MACSDVAFAQSPPTPAPVAVMGGVVSLNASNTSANRAFSASTSAYPAVLFINDGTNEAFVAIGTSSVSATTASMPLPPGNCVTQWLGSNGYFAAITVSSTTTVRALQWNGAPGFSCTSPAIGGSGLTVTQGNPASISGAWPMLSYVPDSTGAFNVNPNAWPHTYGYTGSQLTTDRITNGGGTWIRTYSYTGANLTGLSGWVKQ